jgi:demethylmenaquinone methyltransferase/2-methoxy-6-polyprenyl-1,4-benzoquinol methylase
MEKNVSQKPLKDWTKEERISAVKTIFNTITPNYDLLNRIMSARQDVRWRKLAVRRIPQDVELVLDVATGTGDLAIAMAESRPGASIIGLDFVEKMMRIAQEKTGKHQLINRISYTAGDALHLPFMDAQFDVVTAAFGLRNMPDRMTPISEMRRVLKPGGKLLILEMTFPKNLKLRKFFAWYLNHMIPIIGGAISGDWKAYRYLPDSIQDFLDPEELTKLFEKAGLTKVKTYPMTLGLTYLHEGIAP